MATSVIHFINVNIVPEESVPASSPEPGGTTYALPSIPSNTDANRGRDEEDEQ